MTTRVTVRILLMALAAFAWDPGALAEGPRKPPRTIRNSLGMTFVLVPAGDFVMGNAEPPESMVLAFPAYERRRLDDLADERPAHRVKITRAFYLGQHEVTVGEFAKFIEESGYVPESIADGTGGYGYKPEPYDPASPAPAEAFDGRNPRYSWRDPGFPQGPDHPVVNVTWNDAAALARWLSRTEGVRYRLPTEAEWEYACRAGTRTRFSSGDAPESLSQVANVFDADSARDWPRWQAFALAVHDGYEFTAPVGSFAPNAFGLYDMHGNVWEWVADWYGEHYYSRSPLRDPKGPDHGRVKVRRGGSWHTWAFYARSSFRNWNTVTTRYTLVGIRLLREAGVAGQRPRVSPQRPQRRKGV